MALESVFQFAATLGEKWPTITKAHTATETLHGTLAESVKSITGDDAALVVLGSAGRFEVTHGSDTDWTLLIDGQADPEHRSLVHSVAAHVKNAPGREGTFGGLSFSHSLIQYIGGEDDTNANLTRRILLLLESKPIGRRDAYDRVIRSILERYLAGDHGWVLERTPYCVPRFLHNDIARYWRTVTVDFAYKQFMRGSEEWALKSAKLRFSRKLIYAAGLLYAFRLATNDEHPPPKNDPYRKQEAIDVLWSLTNKTPLDLLAEAFQASPSLHQAGRETFRMYERFLAILDSEDNRVHLKTLKPEDADKSDLYQEVRTLGKDFQVRLNTLFLDDNSTIFPKLTRAYGVF